MVKQLEKTEARQGVTGHKVRYVLAISLALAVVVLGAIAVYGGAARN